MNETTNTQATETQAQNTSEATLPKTMPTRQDVVKQMTILGFGLAAKVLVDILLIHIGAVAERKRDHSMKERFQVLFTGHC